MTNQQPNCLYCKRTSQQVPLLTVVFKDETYWICPEHLPVLIHDPARLIGTLPGAEQLRPAEHRD